MRQIRSSGSVKAIWLDRDGILRKLYDLSRETLAVFPEIMEVRLFGSLAKKEETGLSDIDIFLLIESEEENPIERMKPYFSFFCDKLDIAVDMITATKSEMENFRDILKGSILLSARYS